MRIGDESVIQQSDDRLARGRVQLSQQLRDMIAYSEMRQLQASTNLLVRQVMHQEAQNIALSFRQRGQSVCEENVARPKGFAPRIKHAALRQHVTDASENIVRVCGPHREQHDAGRRIMLDRRVAF